MLAGLRSVDDEGVSVLDHAIVPVARYVPHDDLVALPDALACKLCVSSSRSAHVDDWCLVANSLGDEAWHERGIGLEFRELAWILGQRQEAAQHRVPRRVVSADDE